MNKYYLLFAAFCTMVTCAANAQGGPMIPAPAPVATLSANPFEVTPSPDSERLDYHLLYNNTFNKVDIDEAKADHLSDRQVAKIYKIAKDSGNDFRYIFALVKDGYTFRTLADWYGVPNIKDAQHEQDDIDAYESAYAATGKGNIPRHNRVMSSIDSIKKYH